MRALTVIPYTLALALAILPAAAQAQTLNDAQAVAQKWPQLSNPVSMKSAEFLIDPDLPRTAATPEIEADIENAVAERERSEKAVADAATDVEKHETVVRDAQDVFDRADEELKSQKDQLFRFSDQMTDIEANEKQKTEQRVTDAERAWIQARKKLIQAIDRRDAAIRHGKEAERNLTEARQAESQAVEERVRWLREHPGRAGAVLQRRTIVIRFHRETPIAVADQLFTDFGLIVESGIESIALFIVRTPPIDGTDRQVKDHLRQLTLDIEKKDFVLEAYPNLLLGTTSLPPPSNLATATDHRHYNWFDGTAGTSPAIAMNFPAAWNFANAIAPGTRVRVAVFDGGFSDHDDLDATSICEPIVSTNGHGNAVLGIVGAEFHNALGVAGGTPFAEMVACAPGVAAQSGIAGLAQQLEDRAVPFTALAKRFDEIAQQNPAPRVVNVSLGYRWGQDHIGIAENREDIRELVGRQGATFRALVERYPDVIVVSAAGNDCNLKTCPSHAQWTSPLNWAALGGETKDHLPQAPNVLVVQSNEVDRTQTKTLKSSFGANIAAPGVDVVSTIDGNDYGVPFGTSMAAPQITALVALMLAYNPSLSVLDVRTILDVGSAALMPNAYVALGRAKPASFARDLADLNGVHAVNMIDFQLFANKLIACENGTATANDCFYPREDLNGDGKISRTDLAEVPAGANGSLKVLSDLEVMMLDWRDPTVRASDLPGRLAIYPAVP